MKSGKPNQSAACDRVPVHLAQQRREHVADDHAEEHRQARQEALDRDADEQDRDQRDQRDARLLRELVLGDGREVEADQRHDRAGHDRRQQELDHAVAGAVDDQADEEQRDAGGQDAAERGRQPPSDFAAITGAMNAKLEPVYDGTRFRVIG